MLTDRDLAEIEARANAASPGPWEAMGNTVTFPTGCWVALPGDIPTAAFIAATRSDVPQLVAEVKRLRALLAEREDSRG